MVQIPENSWAPEQGRTDGEATDQVLTNPVVPRMQFYAVEIARNRKGLNDWIYEKAQAEKKTDTK